MMSGRESNSEYSGPNSSVQVLSVSRLFRPSGTVV